MRLTWSDIHLPPRLSLPTWSVLVAVLFAGLCWLVAFFYGITCESSTAQLPLCPSRTLPSLDTFVVWPVEVAHGEEVTIRWSSSHADTVELAAPDAETVSASGSKTIRPEQDLRVTLRATNRAGSVIKSAFIKIALSPPVIQRFTLEPASIIAGQARQLTLSWSVTGADMIVFDGAPGASLDLIGSCQLEPPEADKTYRLKAQNSAGVVEQTATVRVLSPGCEVVSPVAQREGPSEKYRMIASLPAGTSFRPLSRTSTGEWLQVRTQFEGWLPAAAVLCRNLKTLDLKVIEASEMAPEPLDTPTPPVNLPAQ